MENWDFIKHKIEIQQKIWKWVKNNEGNSIYLLKSYDEWMIWSSWQNIIFLLITEILFIFTNSFSIPCLISNFLIIHSIFFAACRWWKIVPFHQKFVGFQIRFVFACVKDSCVKVFLFHSFANLVSTMFEGNKTRIGAG